MREAPRRRRTPNVLPRPDGGGGLCTRVRSMQDNGPETAGERRGGVPQRALADELAWRRKEVARADAIRKAVTASATELLRSLAPDQSIPAVLERIGRASGVSRVQLYVNEEQADGRVTSKLWHEWDAAGIASAADLYKVQDDSIWDRDRLLPFLAKGEAFGSAHSQSRRAHSVASCP